MLPSEYPRDLSGDQLTILREAYVIACRTLIDAGQMTEERGNEVAVEILHLMRRGVDDPQRLATRSVIRSM